MSTIFEAERIMTAARRRLRRRPDHWPSVALAILLATIAGCGEDGPASPDDGGPTIPADPVAMGFHAWDPADFATVLDVGPDQPLASPSDVPWESLQPGTLVRIHHRAEPYRTKWVINTEATADQPLVVLGVPEPVTGQRPVISGDGAVTRLELDYWNEDRSVVKIGGSSLPHGVEAPAHVVVQGLEIRSARPAYSFTDEAGQADVYTSNAAAIHVERGAQVTIENCVLTDCGNGLFAGHEVADLQIRGNHIHGNGIEGSIYEHNSYTECLGILFEFNRYGPLRDGCGGNNLKDRSAGTVIRYNWIKDGNRQLDLVETDFAGLRDDPSYRRTLVYGNLLIETADVGNSQIVHYGGDGGDESWYRKGTLHFYQNTVYSLRSGNTTLLRLSSGDEQADVRNCVVHAAAGGERLAVIDGAGVAMLSYCWLTEGWRASHDGDPSGEVTAGDCLDGDAPGFVDPALLNLTPAAGSPLAEAGGPRAPEVDNHPVMAAYQAHQQGQPRLDGASTIGALPVVLAPVPTVHRDQAPPRRD
jgi:hypothetical protein